MSVSAKLDDICNRLARIEQRMDDGAVTCEGHRKWTASIDRRTADSERKIVYASGALSILSAIFLALAYALWEKVKRKVGLS